MNIAIYMAHINRWGKTFREQRNPQEEKNAMFSTTFGSEKEHMCYLIVLLYARNISKTNVPRAGESVYRYMLRTSFSWGNNKIFSSLF